MGLLKLNSSRGDKPCDDVKIRNKREDSTKRKALDERSQNLISIDKSEKINNGGEGKNKDPMN